MRRVGTGVAYGIVVLASLWFGKLVTGVVFGVMAAYAAAEFFAMERREARLPNELFGVGAAALMPMSAALWGLPGLSSLVTALIAASLVWHTVFLRARTADTATTVFGAVYTGFLLAYLVLIREFDAGLILSIAVVVSVWISDVSAYFVGSLLGRHRLAPQISPKKSWEGFIAGMLGSIVLWAGVPFIPGSGVSLPHALLTGAAVGFGAVIGDLAESRMKREAGVKDSGDSLPGHGGFLDRLDSLILVGLVAYWVLWWGGVR
jgi:phosphatidate cytidylyltransferase